jgi:integrase
LFQLLLQLNRGFREFGKIVIHGSVLLLTDQTYPAALSEVTHACRKDTKMLNNMAEAGYSYSAVKKARTYIAAALEYAVGERIIPVNPAARVELPGAKLRKPTKRSYTLDEMRRLFSGARSVSLREHLIVRIFYVCGLRPGELFALRVDDVEPKLLRIDEALKETEKGAGRVGETKTSSSNAYVSISDDLYKEITLWLSIRNMGDPYHRSRALAPSDLLFPTEAGTSSGSATT